MLMDKQFVKAPQYEFLKNRRQRCLRYRRRIYSQQYSNPPLPNEQQHPRRCRQRNNMGSSVPQKMPPWSPRPLLQPHRRRVRQTFNKNLPKTRNPSKKTESRTQSVKNTQIQNAKTFCELSNKNNSCRENKSPESEINSRRFFSLKFT